MSHACRVLIAALMIAVVGHAASAQQRPSDDAMAAARAFVDASGAAAQFEQVMPLMADQMSKAFRSLAPDRTREIDEAMAEVVKRFISRKSELIDEIAAIYADIRLRFARDPNLSDLAPDVAGRIAPEVTRRALPWTAWGHPTGRRSRECVASLRNASLSLRGSGWLDYDLFVIVAALAVRSAPHRGGMRQLAVAEEYPTAAR